MESIKKFFAWIGGIGTLILALFAIRKLQTKPKQLTDENEKKILTKTIENANIESDIKKLDNEREALESNYKKESDNVKNESIEDLAEFFNNRPK